MTSAAEFQAKVDKTVTNMDRMDGIVNGSDTATVNTDNGIVPSMAKVLKDFQNRADTTIGEYGDLTILAAEVEANSEQVAADRVQTGLDRAATGTDRVAAQGYANTASSAAEAALLSGSMYPNVTEGLAGTSSGDLFYVYDEGGDTFVTLYRNDSGSATELNKYASASAVADKAQADALGVSGSATDMGAWEPGSTIPNGVSAKDALQTLSNSFKQRLNLRNHPYNAAGDGVTDDTDAIERWLLDVGPNIELYAPAGTYRYVRPLTTPSVSEILIRGAGRRNTVFLYAGASTTADLATFGTEGNDCHMDLSGFSVDSAVMMTAGFAIVIQDARGGFSVKDVNPGANTNTPKTRSGIKFANTNCGVYEGFEFRQQATGIQVVGKDSSDSGSDLKLDNGLILGGTDQIHVAGGFGGLYVGQILAYGGDVGLKLDESVIQRGNREIILSDMCCIDAQNSTHIEVNATSSNLFLTINAFLSGAGFFTASPGIGIDIKSCPYGVIQFNGLLKSSASHGIRYADETCSLYVSNTAYIGYIGGDAIHSTVDTSNIFCSTSIGTVSGFRLTPNIRPAIEGLPVSSQTGVIGSALARWKSTVQGNMLSASINITISDNGTAAGALGVTIPYTFKDTTSFYGVDDRNKAVVGYVMQNTNVMVITYYDGSYPGGAGRQIAMSGTGEVYG